MGADGNRNVSKQVKDCLIMSACERERERERERGRERERERERERGRERERERDVMTKMTYHRQGHT